MQQNAQFFPRSLFTEEGETPSQTQPLSRTSAARPVPTFQASGKFGGNSSLLTKSAHLARIQCCATFAV